MRKIWFKTVPLLTALVLLVICPACVSLKDKTPAAPPRLSTPEPGRPAVKKEELQKIPAAETTDKERQLRDEEATKQYVEKLEEIKSGADRAFSRENFGEAARTYQSLLIFYPDFLQGISSRLSFSKAELESRFADCKTILYRRGFQEYRAGNINGAIAYWQDYLSIDPDNTDIKNALNTAKTQQKNLQQTPADKH